MKAEKINQLLEELGERLDYYRIEKAITAYAPLKFDLKKRIEQLETQIKHIRDFAKENSDKEIEFKALENLHSSLMNESHFATNFEKLSSVFVENSKNVVIGNVITADKIHIGDNYYYQYGDKKIKRFLTKLPYNEKFEGRKKELAKLKEQIATHKSISLISINGIGGIGKSALSKAFFLENYKEYDFALFLEGKSTVYDTFNDYTLLDNLAIAEKIHSIPYQTPNRNEIVFDIIKNALSNLEGKKLLLIDDASENAHLLKELIQSDWEILTTSRQKIDFMFSFELLQATPKDAVAIFCVYYEKAIENLNQEEKTHIQNIVNRLAFHPLAIELVAKNVKRKDWSFEETNQKLAEKGLNIDEKTNLSTTHSQEKIKDIFKYLLQLFPLENLTEEELKLLNIYSVLPNLPITKQTWKTLLGETEDHWQELSTQLNERGLINKNGKAFEIHALLAEIVRYKNEERLDGDCEGMVISLIDKLNPETNFNYHKENYKYTSLYINYVKSIAFYIKNTEILAMLYERIGDFYGIIGTLKLALEYFEKYNNLEKQLYIQLPQNVSFQNGLAVSYYKLGQTHQALGNLKIALKFLKKSSKLVEQLYKKFPTNVYFKNGLAISYSQQGRIHTETGNLKLALDFFEKENKLFKQLYYEFNQNFSFKNGLAISYERIGAIHWKLGNLELALVFFEKRKDLAQQLYSEFPNNVNFKNGLAISYQYLGITYKALRQLQLALTFYIKYNELTQQLYQEFPANINFKNVFAISFLGLGEVQEELKNIIQARIYYSQGRELYKELVNIFPQHTSFVTNLNWVEDKLKELQ